MIRKQYFNNNKRKILKSHTFRKWFLRSGHILLPDSDLGREATLVGVGVTRDGRDGRETNPVLSGEEVSPSGNIYVMAGSVVQCSHDTGGETPGAGGLEGDNCNSSLTTPA